MLSVSSYFSFRMSPLFSQTNFYVTENMAASTNSCSLYLTVWLPAGEPLSYYSKKSWGRIWLAWFRSGVHHWSSHLCPRWQSHIAQREHFPWLESSHRVRELPAPGPPRLLGVLYPLHHWSTPFGGCLRPQAHEFNLGSMNSLKNEEWSVGRRSSECDN